VNNLPKVVTSRHLEQDLNSRPVVCKLKRLTRCTTAPPSPGLSVGYLSRVRRHDRDVPGSTVTLPSSCFSVARFSTCSKIPFLP